MQLPEILTLLGEFRHDTGLYNIGLELAIVPFRVGHSFNQFYSAK